MLRVLRCLQLEAGGLDAVIEAMKSHMDDPEILNAAMKCLGRMCVNEGVAKLMGEKVRASHSLVTGKQP